jgi:hypothetical protein
MSIEKIKELVEKHPRHFSRMIKKDDDLAMLIEQNSLIKSDNYAAVIRSALFQETGICSLGNTLKFKSITDGFGFCGRANSCECARKQVASSVSASIQNYSDTKKSEIQAKREQTNQKLYGVSNTGQTQKAIEAHTKFYENEDNVATVLETTQRTKLARHGNQHYTNIEKCKDTWKTRQTDYWQDRYPDKDITALNDPSLLAKLFKKMTVAEIATETNVHIQTVYRYLNKHDLRIPYSSSYEIEIKNFLEQLGITNIVSNTRSLIPSRKEIDIYLPDYNLAIEFNGIYWHHENIPHITKTYHADKFFECEQLGIQLLTIFSDSWHRNKDVIKKTIISKLGISIDRIFARNTIVKKITSKETKDFLNANHNQGYTAATICYGLYYKDILVAVMTFAKNRIAMGKPSVYMELVRYASNIRVVGGAGKLLAAFRKEYPDEEVLSYSNNELSNGNLYRSLGFTLATEIPPSYYYIDPKTDKLVHRFNFAKQRLIKYGADPTMTSNEICAEWGIFKIWDCGKRKWILK